MTFFELLASHDNWTVCAAAEVDRAERMKVSMSPCECCLRREMSHEIASLAPCLRTDGGLKSGCTAILIAHISRSKLRSVQLGHYLHPGCISCRSRKVMCVW